MPLSKLLNLPPGVVFCSSAWLFIFHLPVRTTFSSFFSCGEDQPNVRFKMLWHNAWSVDEADGFLKYTVLNQMWQAGESQRRGHTEEEEDRNTDTGDTVSPRLWMMFNHKTTIYNRCLNRVKGVVVQLEDVWNLKPTLATMQLNHWKCGQNVRCVVCVIVVAINVAFSC